MAKHNLVIVESPTKTKTLKKYLGDGFVVESSVGHIRDLPKSKLGVDVDNNFEPEYIQVKGKSKVTSKLKSEAAKAEVIYLATDPDREGEAISWHIAELLAEKSKIKDLKSKLKRISFHEITKTAVEEAMKHPRDVDMALVDAQQARRVLDRLVGYKLSPVLWKKVRRGLSAGRVQSVALRMVVEREREIEAFKPQEYWEINVQVATGKKDEFAISLYEVDGKKFEADSETKVKPVVADLKKAKYVVESVEKKERSRSPYPPFITSTLQRAAATFLGWSGKQTMQVAQQLYEAGLITYHRTDSVNLANEAVAAAREMIEKEFGKTHVPETPNYYKTKSKSAQEAHEAIRPTDAKKREIGDELNGKLEERHEKLYRLIWRRFIACQMKPSIFDQTTVVVMADKKYRLKAVGSVVKFEGWRKAYEEAVKSDEAEVILPSVETNDPLTYINLTDEQKFTQPPPRYNDASLVKELEKRGIGRPSTYASIISVLVDRGYVERQEKRFFPTVIGITVVDFLVEHFKEVMDYDFTAEMEEDLDRIALGEKQWREVMAVFWKPFVKQLETTEEKAKRVEIPVEQTGEKCPDCKEGDLIIRTGRFGKFISCSRFPECKYTAKFVEKLEGFMCPECGAEVVVKRTKRGRTFYGCSTYPTCDWASWQDPRANTSPAAPENLGQAEPNS